MAATESVSGASATSQTSVGQTTVTIPVWGMSCAACQSHVEGALRQTPGVGAAEVNLMTHSARVVFDPLVAKPETLVEAVKNSGYDSSLPLDEHEHAGHMHHSDSSEGQLRVRALATLGMAAVAMVLSMPLMQGMSTHSKWLARLPATLA